MQKIDKENSVTITALVMKTKIYVESMYQKKHFDHRTMFLYDHRQHRGRRFKTNDKPRIKMF